jgi:hypothetical protein
MLLLAAWILLAGLRCFWERTLGLATNTQRVLAIRDPFFLLFALRRLCGGS